MGQLSLRISGGRGLIPANWSVSEYWVGSSDLPFSCGDGANVGPGAARAIWKHWQSEARAASDDGGSITRLADWVKTSWTSFRLCYSIHFWISCSICRVNCWPRPGKGVNSTLHVSPVADVEADASSGSGPVVTDTALMARVACVPKLASLELPPYSGECILGGIQFGHTLPGTPSRTGLWTSSLSVVVSPSLGPHSRHVRRLEQVLSDARRWGAWHPPRGCKHPHSRVRGPQPEPPVWRSNRATPPQIGASGQPIGNNPIWRPLPDNCTKVPSSGQPWRNDTGRGPHSDCTLPLQDSTGLTHKLSRRLRSPVCEHSPRNSGPQNQGGPGLRTPHLRVPQSYNEYQDSLIRLGSTPPLDKAWHSGAGFSGETRDDD